MSSSRRPQPTTVGAVALTYLHVQRDALLEGEAALRIGEPAVHATRVAIRRFRSVLRAFGALFEDDLTVPIDAELQWYAQVLGEVRDREVQRERMAAAVAALPADLVHGPVAADIERVLLGEQEHYEAEVLRELDAPRYRALVGQLDEWLATPPLTSKAAQPAQRVRRYVERAVGLVVAKLAAADKSGDDEQLHSARKAGKRARYATELAGDHLGAKATRMLARLTAVQTELGEFQDSIVAGELLLRLGHDAVMDPSRDGFTYGVLVGQERQRAADARRQATRLMTDLI